MTLKRPASVPGALAWRVAVLVLLLAAALEGTAAGAPGAADPRSVCAAADTYASHGHLAEAAALYGSKVDGAPLPCLDEGLRKIDQQRSDARAAVAAGRRQLREGDTEEAAEQFDAALKHDVTDTAALEGLAKAGELDSRGDTAALRWDHFYHDWFTPALRLLVPFLVALAVLWAVSSLLSGWLVRVDSVEWPTRILRGFWKTVGVLLLLGSAVMFPVYPMFHPFTAEAVVPYPAVVTPAVLLLLTLATVGTAAARSDAPQRTTWGHWTRLLTSMATVGIAGLATALWVWTEPAQQLLTAYLVCTVYGVMLTGAVFGQNLRLQVAVQTPDGKTDAAATDYLLARMQTLGTESARRLYASANRTPLSSALSSDSLSALPAGTVVGTLSGIFFALRPDLTWRARADVIDDNRIAITLSRNSTHAASTIFSRRDLGLPTVEAESQQGRLRAQLLTGAAAFVLVQLSRRHEQLKEGLHGARNWKSVTLQVIAGSKSLIDDPGLRTELLARAVNEDFGNVLARLDYLWALQEATTPDDPPYRQFADALDDELRDRPVLRSGSPTALQIRARYHSTAQWINLYARGRDRIPYVDLARAGESSERLGELLAEFRDKNPDPDMVTFADQMQALADVLGRDIDALKGERFAEPAGGDLVPRVAYEKACLHVFRNRSGEDHTADAIEQLRYALPTERDKKEAWEEICLAPLRGSPEFRRMVGESAGSFLDLPVFDAARSRLREAGLCGPADLVLRTETERQRTDLAGYLDVPPVVVDRYRQIAQFARSRPQLADPAMLHLLISVGVDSTARLLEEARHDRRALIRKIRARARESQLGNPADLDRLGSWLPR